MPISKDLVDRLRQEPESVVIADADLADIFSLIAPRLHFSAMASSQTLRSPDGSTDGTTTADRFQNYLCVKRLLSQQQDVPSIDPAVFGVLDRGFRYLHQDFPLIHLNRKSEFTPVFDPTEAPARCLPRPLRIFPALVLGPQLGQAQLPETITTPPQQWAYASVVDLMSSPGAVAVGTRLI